MDSARIAKNCQEFSVGVIPPDGTQLEVSIWYTILGLSEKEDGDAFMRQLRKDNVPRPKFCGKMFIDSTHIRRIVFSGRSEDAKGD